MEQLKYKLSTALSVLFIIFSFAVGAQNISKGAGVLYTNGVPGTTPRPQFDPEFAINLSNGYIYQWNRSRAVWNYIGSGIGKHNSNNAPVTAPQYSDPLFLINNSNDLYFYTGTSWVCINCNIDTDDQTLSIDKDTLTISEGNSVILPGEVSNLNLIAPLPFSPTKGDIALKQVDVNGSKVFYAFDGVSWVEGGMFLDTLNVATINIVDDAVTFDKTQNINTNRILGRYSAGSGNIQEIKVGGGLAINNDTLIATGIPSSIFYQFIRENGVVENQRSILSFINSNDIVFSATDDPGIENETEIRATIQLDAVDSTKVNNGSLSLRDLSQDGAASGDVIKWDGTKWVTNPDLNSGNTDLSFNGDTLRSSSGTDVRIISGTGISTTSNSSSITITNSSPDQVVSITGGGINSISGTYPSFTVTGTEVDGSVTNEIQQIDTFSLSGNILRVSLSSDNVPAKSVDLSPYVNVATDLSFNLDTLRSSTGTDVRIIAGTGMTTSSTSSGITINNAGDLSNTNELQNLSYNVATSALTISGGTGTAIPIFLGATGVDGERGLVPKPFAGEDTYFLRGDGQWWNIADQLLTNEGSLTVGAGASNTSLIQSNTSGSTAVTIQAGTGLSISEAGNTITLTNSAPDQTVSITGAGINNVTGTYPSFTITGTEVDGSVTNEIQQIDTFSLSSNIIRISLSSDNVPAKTIDLSPYVNVGTDLSFNGDTLRSSTGTDVRVISGTGISTSSTASGITINNTAPDQTVVLNSGTGISASGTYPNFTITNTAPDQTVSISSGSGISVSGTYPSFTVTNTGDTNAADDITGTLGSTQIPYATGAQTVSSEAALSYTAASNTLTIGETGGVGTLAFADTSTTTALISVKGTRFLHTIDNRSSTIDLGHLFLGYGSGSTTASGQRSIGIGNRALSSVSGGINDIIAIGASSMGSYLSGGSVIAIGSGAMANRTGGSSIVAIGQSAVGGSGTSGSVVGIGALALSVSTGTALVAVGTGAMEKSTTGTSSVAIGSSALGSSVFTGSQTVAIGPEAMRFAQSSSNNVAIGANALRNGRAASGNVAIGSDAGFGVRAGSNNTLIGYQTAYNSDSTLSNSILIGYQAGYNETQSNRLYIENSNSTTPLIGGDFSTNQVGVNIAHASLAAALHAKGNGSTSSTFTLRADNSQDSVIISARDDRRVGINTSSPQEELDVNGNIKLNSFAPTPATIAAYNSTNVLSKLLVGSGLTINGDTLKSTGGSGNTNLAFTGTSSPVTLTSSTGTDVTITAGTGVSLSATATDVTITNSSPDQTVSITNGGGISVSGTYPNFTLTATDDSATNEGSLTVGAGTGTTSLINSNTSGSTAVTIEAGTGIGISESGSTITLTNSGDLSNTNEIQNLSYTAATGAIGISGGGSGTTIPVMTSTVRGLVPDGDGTGTDEFLREDGSWAVIPDASTTVTGLVNQTAQSFSGLKQFTDNAVVGESGTSGILALTTGTVGEDVFVTTGTGGAWTMTLPTNDGNNNQVLRTDGLGVTSWASIDSNYITNGSISLLDLQQDGAASGEVIKWNGTRWITDTDNAGGVADGDKGDITVSSSGTVWSIDASAVGNSELASNAVDSTKIVNGGISLLDLQQDGAATGEVIKWNGTRWITDTDNSGGAPAWSSLTAPSGNLSLAHGANTTNFTFNSVTTQDAFTLSSTSLTSGSIMKIESNGTAAISNQTGLEIALSGASSGSPITYGSTIVNSHTGGGASANYGISSTAVNAEENCAVRADAYGGSMNYGVYSSAVSSAVNEAWGVFSSVTGDGVSYGVYASAGSSNDNYAIYADARNGDFDNYAIYTDLGDIRFGDLASAGNRIVGASSFGLLSVITPSTGLSLSGGNLTATDASVSNEGSLSVAAGGSNDSQITSNTSGSSAIVISGGSNVTVTESGNTITIASSGGSGVSVISPSNITVTQNNYNPTGWSTATHVFLTSSTEVGITGFQQGNDGDIKRITNRGSNNIYIPGNHPSSGASKRVNVSTDYVLRPKESIEMAYSGTDSLWYIVGDKSKCSSCVEYSWSAASVTAGDNSDISQVAINSGTATTAVVTSSGLPRPSLSLSTAALSNGGAAVGFPKTTNAIGYYDSTRVCFSAYLTLQDTSDATNAFIAGITLVPLVTSTAAAHENNSISISYTHSNNGGRWYGKTVSSTGTTTEVDLGIKMVDDRAYLLEICLDKNANEARFYINGVLKGVLTATMPSATTISGRAQIHKTAGTTARLLRVHSMKAYAE